MRDLTDRDGTDAAATYRRAASIKHWLGDPEGGVELVEHAIRIHRSASPSVEFVLALHEHDSLLIALGRYDEAAASAVQALDICAIWTHPWSTGACSSSSPTTTSTEGDLERALSHLDQAAGIELTGPDPEGDIYLGIMLTETLRLAGKVGDEVAEAGRPGLESAASWGLETFPALILRGNLSGGAPTVGSGRSSRGAHRPGDRAGATHSRGHADPPERASLDMLRGRCAEALARFDSLAAMPVAGSLEPDRCGRGARERGPLVRSCAAGPRPTRGGAPGRQWRRDASAEIGSRPGARRTCCCRRGGRSRASDASRRELHDQLHRLLDQAQIDPFARSGCFEARPAHGAAWAAETARLLGRPSLELWAEAARHWDRLGRPTTRRTAGGAARRWRSPPGRAPSPRDY